MSYAITSQCTGCTACVAVCPVQAISGERKGLHRIDAAICIDCGACGRICPYQAIHDQANALCLPVKRSQWPKPKIDPKTCVSCGICLEVCPTGVLDLIQISSQHAHPVAHLYRAAGCIGCAFCEQACPVSAIVMDGHSKG